MDEEERELLKRAKFSKYGTSEGWEGLRPKQFLPFSDLAHISPGTVFETLEMITP